MTETDEEPRQSGQATQHQTPAPLKGEPTVAASSIVKMELQPATSTSSGAVQLCHHLLEKDGGAFGCRLPARHCGPHVTSLMHSRRPSPARTPSAPPTSMPPLSAPESIMRRPRPEESTPFPQPQLTPAAAPVPPPPSPRRSSPPWKTFQPSAEGSQRAAKRAATEKLQAKLHSDAGVAAGATSAKGKVKEKRSTEAPSEQLPDSAAKGQTKDVAAAAGAIERGLNDPYYTRWHSGPETWEVEDVVDVDVRDTWPDGRPQAAPTLRCRVKWQGWLPECDTWEPLQELLGPEAKEMAQKTLLRVLRRSLQITRQRKRRQRRRRKQQAAAAVHQLWAAALALGHGAKVELPFDGAAAAACTAGVKVRLGGVAPLTVAVAADAPLEALLRPQPLARAAKPEPYEPSRAAAEQGAVTVRLGGVAPLTVAVAADAPLEALLRPQEPLARAAKPEPYKPNCAAAKGSKVLPPPAKMAKPAPPLPHAEGLDARSVRLHAAPTVAAAAKVARPRSQAGVPSVATATSAAGSAAKAPSSSASAAASVHAKSAGVMGRPPPPPPPRTINSRLVVLNGAAYAPPVPRYSNIGFRAQSGWDVSGNEQDGGDSSEDTRGGSEDGGGGSEDGRSGSGRGRSSSSVSSVSSFAQPPLLPSYGTTVPLGTLAGLWPEMTLPYDRVPWMAELRAMEHAQSASATGSAAATKECGDVEAMFEPLAATSEGVPTAECTVVAIEPASPLAADNDATDEANEAAARERRTAPTDEEDEEDEEEDDELSALWHSARVLEPGWSAQLLERRLLTPPEHLRRVVTHAAPAPPLVPSVPPPPATIDGESTSDEPDSSAFSHAGALPQALPPSGGGLPPSALGSATVALVAPALTSPLSALASPVLAPRPVGSLTLSSGASASAAHAPPTRSSSAASSPSASAHHGMLPQLAASPQWSPASGHVYNGPLHTVGFHLFQRAVAVDAETVEAIRAAKYNTDGLPLGPHELSPRDPNRLQTLDGHGKAAWCMHLKRMQGAFLRRVGVLVDGGGVDKRVRKMHALRSLPTPGYDVARSVACPQAAQFGDQAAHIDEDPRLLLGRADADMPLSTLLAIEEGTRLRLRRRDDGAWTVVELAPGDLLVWRGDVCHHGMGYAEENFRVHAYVHPVNYHPSESHIYACPQ